MVTEQTAIKVRLPRWRKAKIQRAAELAGESMSAFLLMAVDAEIERQRKIIDAGLGVINKQSPA